MLDLYSFILIFAIIRAKIAHLLSLSSPSRNNAEAKRYTYDGLLPLARRLPSPLSGSAGEYVTTSRK